MFQSPLRGVRIVEQGTFITGPCAAMMLADLGADVIKVESPEGDPYRSYQRGHYSPHFQAYNRNKRSLSCDLKQPGDREIFDQLVASADVYLQNFRPGTAERLGAGVKRLRGLNPGSFTARSADSALTVPTPSGRATTPSRRRCPVS